MFTDAKSIVDYINANIQPSNPRMKAYVGGINREDVIMEFLHIAETLTLPEFESDGLTAVTIPSGVKFQTVKCQYVNVVQSGNAV